ncbi:sigma-70 family RNA polymerase sigma factor [Actinosynnema sp. NPDC020468]|uniref:sigma-70 family RNA polymerase sigma factor n=1 Tax=Actinosynnema sp. NPDC020468 TaxID=3154488 RepID=UPI0033DE6E65
MDETALPHDLLDRLRDGDPAARRALFTHCHERLRPYFARHLPNASDVDDCVSEVVTRALEGIAKGRAPEVLGAWLHGIARNVRKERYEANRRAWRELPAEVRRPEADVPVELIGTPDLPADLEHLLGKRELWSVLQTAVGGIPEGLREVLRAHIEETVRRGRLVVGRELATVLGLPPVNVDRQLGRARDRAKDVIAAVVLARSGRDACTGLAELVPAGAVALDPPAARRVTKHAAACPTCGRSAEEVRAYSRWALGPGLLGLAEDDDRHRFLAAFLGHGPTATAGGGVVGVEAGPDLPAVRPSAGVVERVRAAVAHQLGRVDAVVRVVQENPETARRLLVGITSGVTLAGAVLWGLFGAEPREPGPVVAGPAPVTTSATPFGEPVVVVGDTTSPTTAPPGATGVRPATAVPPTGRTGTPAPPAPAAGAPVEAVEAVTTASTPTTAPTTTTTAPTTPVTTTTPARTTPTAPPTSTTAPAPTTTTNPPPPWSGDITVDAEGLGYTAFSVSAQPGWRPVDQPATLRLSPGAYAVTSPANIAIPFSVTDSGAVDYPTAYDAVLGGRGTATLRVRGLPITVDTSALSYYNATVSGVAPVASNPARTLNLFPGDHAVQTPSGDRVPFRVDGQGLVHYAAEHLLDGEGTATLTVHGLALTVDFTDTSYSTMTVSGTGWPTPQPVRTLRLLPGAHTALSPNGLAAPFRLLDDGTVRTDSPLLEPVGSTLRAHGLPITYDVSDVDYENMAVTGTGWPAPSPVRHLRVWPGAHQVLTSSGAKLDFTVTPAGLVDYDPSVEALLTGAGTTTLAVHGLPITVDATATGRPALSVAGAGGRDARVPQTYRLLPGAYALVLGPNRYAFTADRAGRVDYDPALDAVLSGRGTGTLTARG